MTTTVAVTGGAGFIGSATVRELLRRGFAVRSLDLTAGPAGVWALDVRDPLAVHAALEGCDAVIHLAGILGTEELFADPLRAVDVNVKGAINVLEACVDHRLSYVGITMLQVWQNVYQATKNCADRLASAWHMHHGVPVSHVRAFNGFGPGQAYGPGHPQKIAPTFAAAAWNGRPIPVWGDGTQFVDLVHVDDIGRMLVEALNFGGDETFDAGSGIAVTVNDVARHVLDVTGSSAGVQHLPMRKGEHRADDVVATGLGWDRLLWHPTFIWDDLTATIESYADALWYVDDRAEATLAAQG